MFKNLLLIILLIVFILTGCTCIPLGSSNKNNVESTGNETLMEESNNNNIHNNIIFKKVLYDTLELNILAEVGNVDPFDVPLKIKCDNNKNELSTYIKYKDRDFINTLSNGDILIDGKYLLNSSKTLHQLFKDKYVFDFAVHKKLDLMALLFNDNGISLFLYDFNSNDLKRLYSLNFKEQDFSDISLTLDWLDENNIVFDCSDNGNPSIFEYNILNNEVKRIIEQGMNPRAFDSSISYITTTNYNLLKSKIPITTIYYTSYNKKKVLHGWYKRANIDNEYLLLYNTHLNPEIYRNYNTNFLVSKNFVKELSLKGRPFFPIINQGGNIDYFYYNEGKLINDVITIN